MVDSDDREAYEEGQKRRDDPVYGAINDLGEAIFGTSRSESEEDALQKGERGEQLDADKSDSTCFLTTACIRARGLPDDCIELETLRRFRDQYVQERQGGQSLIREYYEIAPQIVTKIRQRSDSNEIFSKIYTKLVAPCVQLINRGENDEALTRYERYVSTLKEEFLEG